MEVVVLSIIALENWNINAMNILARTCEKSLLILRIYMGTLACDQFHLELVSHLSVH